MVKYLTAYITLQTDQKAVYKVDIKREVENFKRKHPNIPNPVVIFDFIGTIPILFRNYTEVVYGGRHNECIRRAETLFQKFRDLGIDLVFFLDGPIKEMKLPEWIRRKNREYEEQKRLFANLKAQEPIRYRFQKYLKTYYENYLRVAKKYGRVFISFQNECDLDIAEFATRSGSVLAVLGRDSDFLVMPGDWPIWIPDTLNIRNMTIEAWNKRKLRESLGLEQWQMPILATLSGSDWLEFKHVEHLRKRFKGELVQVEKALAGFICQTFQDRKDLSIRLADLIYNGGRNELSFKEIDRLVNMCLNFYDYKNHKITRVEPDWLRDHISETANSHVYMIYYQNVLKIPQSFVDVSKDDVSSFSDLVLPLLRREIGIMYNSRREKYRDFKQRIALKPSEIEPFCVKEYTPIYPDFEVPEMDDILSNDDDIISLEKRVEILSWVVSPKRKKLSADHVLKLLKTIFVVPSLVVNYLVQERQITVDEADTILLAIFEASKMDSIKAECLKPPEAVTERPFWLSHLYTNLVRYFDEAMIFCGLYTYVPHTYYDGYLFHKMYTKFLGMKFDEKLKIRKPISDYRLYAL